MRVGALLTSTSKGRTAGLLLASVSIAVTSVAVASPANAHSTPTLQRGDTGPCVSYVQKNIGVSVDGIFGPATQTGVMNFERRHGLTVNGIVGSSIWNRIGACPYGLTGYVQLPVSSDGSYRFEAPTCRGQHYGSADLVNVLRNVAARWKAKYPNGRLNIGDLNATGHASHMNGIDFDLDATTNGRDWVADYTRGNYNRQATIELARMFADTGKLQIIFYNDQQVINALGGKMKYWPNHANHFHVRINTAKLATWAPECDGRH